MKRRFSLWRCRRTGKRWAVSGCGCVCCVWRRSYIREWQRDQIRGKTAYYRRRKLAIAAAHRRWRAKQDPLVMLMVTHLRYLARETAND
jgi:hypothetical protein